MSLQSSIANEFLSWGALSFVAAVDWERSRQRRIREQRHWPWTLLFAAFALIQLAIAVLHPEATAELNY